VKTVASWLTYLLLVTAFVVGIQAPVNFYATAAHKQAAYSVPHDVASWIVDYDIGVMVSFVERYDRQGCDDIAVGPIRDEIGSLFGYIMLARDENGDSRLVWMEAFNLQREKVYGYRNIEDYDALVACHERPVGISM